MNSVSTNTKETGNAYAPSEDRWNAVIRRDRNADAKFYYDVLDPASQRPWPPTPEIVRRLAERAAVQAGFMSFQPDSCLINRYEPGAHNSRSIRIETSAILASRSFRFRLGCRQYSFSVANFATSDHRACVARAETSSCGAELHGLRFTG
jgi:alkylated DNA repair dioxygenase AlkB